MNQEELILVALKNGEKITPISALENFGCLRLSARIWSLRNQGYPILKRALTTPQGKVVAQYYMEESDV